MIQSSQGFSLPGGWKYQAGEKKKTFGLFQLHKLLPEASKCCKNHTQIFRFLFNQIPGHLDLFKCQQPARFPNYFRFPYISKCSLFHRNSKSNLGAHRVQKSQVKTLPARPVNQLIMLQPPAALQRETGSSGLWIPQTKIPFVYRHEVWL